MFIHDDSDDVRRRSFTRRAVLLGIGQAVGLGAITARLYQLQVVDEARYAPLADNNRINVQVLAPERGRIFDRFGVELAGNKDGFQAVIVRSLAGDMAQVLRRFSKIVPLSLEAQARVISRANRQSLNRPVVVARDLTWEQFAEINLRAPQLPGIQSHILGRRQYFHGHEVGHIVGYVGSIHKLALDDDPVLRLPGVRVGKVGIERGMEQRLRGKGGIVKYEVDARGRIIRNLERTPPKRGRDVALTIDLGLQRQVMKLVGEHRRAAVVAMDVLGGEVVAMASAPSYDPQQIVGGVSAEKWKKLRNAADDPLMNRAIRGQYPPGSTFKMVTALAALEAGVIDLDEEVTCEGKFEVADSVFRCWNRSGHGACNLHRALRESCDVYFYELAERLGIRALAAMSRKLGFGQTHDMGIALQKPGLIPDPDWKFGRYNKSWYTGETILAGIGQGYVLSTPLQLAVMTARIAGGRFVSPTLVRPQSNEALTPAKPLDIAPKWLHAVRAGMYAVVNERRGTGHNARFPDDEVRVAGKTGTSQVTRLSSSVDQEDLPWNRRDHALFVGYYPAEKPRYAVSAVVEHGGSGGASAAPLVRDVMGLLYDGDPDVEAGF